MHDAETFDPATGTVQPVIELADIVVTHEGRGLGSAVLGDLCSYADRHQLTIVGSFMPGRYEVNNLAQDDRSRRTASWYRRHGFDLHAGRLICQPIATAEPRV